MVFSKKELELLELYNNSGVDLFFENQPKNRVTNVIESKQILKNNIPGEVQKFISSSRKIANGISDFTELCNAIQTFDGCEIKKTAINTVIYDGQLDAKIMAIGEAPGASEDEQGIPFCGQSGKLLDKVFQSIGLSRKQNLFITNTIFWRPPGNRRPTPEEIDNCRPFLEKMIALLQPYLIIMVGNTAVESLLGLKSIPMHAIREQEHRYTNSYLAGQNIEAVAIFHPSYLLRQPAQKKLMWFDVLRIAKKIKAIGI